MIKKIHFIKCCIYKVLYLQIGLSCRWSNLVKKDYYTSSINHKVIK